MRVRPTARVLLLDDDDRVLMLRVHDPSVTVGPNAIPADFWLLVGGGVEAGESWEAAARREVREETGITEVAVGRCVYEHEKVVGNADGELELRQGRYFVGRVRSGTPVRFDGHEPLEASTITGFRWFTHAEILVREQHETVLPHGLGALLGEVLAEQRRPAATVDAATVDAATVDAATGGRVRSP